MAELTTTSPLARKIVFSFLDFLTSVKPSPGVDLEGLEVARDCLAQVFDLDLNSTEDEIIAPYLLVNYFRSCEALDNRINRPFVKRSTIVPGTSVDLNKAIKDELLVKFIRAIDNVHFLTVSGEDDDDDATQIDTAVGIFYRAFKEAEKSGVQNFDLKTLGVTMKSLGNEAMKAKDYTIAVDMYSSAIACENNNPVYYCNRAAAYTQICGYEDAILDCEKSIELDPCYSKAYSRLGTAYYARGNFRDALYKGFSPALQLDPDNEGIKENIRVTEQKLTQLHQGQSSGSGPTLPPMFAGGTAGVDATQADFAEILRNIAGNIQNSGVGPTVTASGAGPQVQPGVDQAIRHMFTMSISQGGPGQPGSGPADDPHRPTTR